LKKSILELIITKTIVHGLFPEAVNYDKLKKHYDELFASNDDGVLMSLMEVVAGPYLAQKYLSWFTLKSEFLGLPASGKRLYIRGQTIFKFDDNVKVIERWSNHDQEFRDIQMKKMAEELGVELKSTGMYNEETGEKFVKEDIMFGVLDKFEEYSNETSKHQSIKELFASNAQIFLQNGDIKDVKGFLEYMNLYWESGKTSFFIINDGRINGGNNAAQKFILSIIHMGSDLFGYKATQKLVTLNGQMVAEFNQNGLISRLYFNPDEKSLLNNLEQNK
jgi:hypothetical protein